MSVVKKPTVLIASSNRWPLAARLAIALSQYGCDVYAVCPSGHPLRYATGLNKIYSYSGMDSTGSLAAAMLHSSADIVIPCDDIVVTQLYWLYKERPELKNLLEFSLGVPETWPILETRDGLMKEALAAGVRVPAGQVITSEQQLADWPEPIMVLKRNGTLGGSGVVVARSKEEAVSAYRKLREPMSLSSAIKRYIINREPEAFWLWRHAATPVVTAQQFVPGRPANTMIVCDAGKVLGLVTVEVLRSAGVTGAATTVRIIRHAEIEETARILAERLKLTGFHGLDFMIASGEGGHPKGAAYIIELNPRSTQLGSLRLPQQGDLAGILCRRLYGKLGLSMPEIPQRPAIRGDIVAFFPQAVKANPENPYLMTGYHDVPWEQPAMVSELLQPLWPFRQWPGNLYQKLVPSTPGKEIIYEE